MNVTTRLLPLGLGLVLVLAANGEAQTRGKPQAQPAILASAIREEPSPVITTIKGVGSANAVAEARMNATVLGDHCAAHATVYPSRAACLKMMQKEFGSKVFRATADCTTGRISTTSGLAYTLDGVWDKTDIGGGRTRWRDADGNVVGRDLINNGLHISQQWETLCPGPVTASLIARAKAQPRKK